MFGELIRYIIAFAILLIGGYWIVEMATVL